MGGKAERKIESATQWAEVLLEANRQLILANQQLLYQTSFGQLQGLSQKQFTFEEILARRSPPTTVKEWVQQILEGQRTRCLVTCHSIELQAQLDVAKCRSDAARNGWPTEPCDDIEQSKMREVEQCREHCNQLIRTLEKRSAEFENR